MARRFRVALLVESSFASGRDIQRGIAHYARTHGSWTIVHQIRSLHDAAPAAIRKWGCHGILARIEHPRLIKQIRQLKLPAVDLLHLHDLPDISSVSADDRAVAHMAGDELIARGFQRFAFCGFPGTSLFDQRCRHFIEHVSKTGGDVHVYETPKQRNVPTTISKILNRGLADERRLANWLKGLSKPIGLMTPNDVRAQQVLSVCAYYDIAVPEEIAVIGVDNDEILCEMSDPPLTSVDLNAHARGYQAASMLDEMMRSGSRTVEHILVPPNRVVVRQSTNVLAISDPVVARAVRFIRENTCERISVDQIAESVQITRRTLERRFQKVLGRGPGDEIQRLRFHHIEELLKTSDFPLKKIAQLAGFRHTESMCHFFRKKAGRTPGQFRKASGLQQNSVRLERRRNRRIG